MKGKSKHFNIHKVKPGETFPIKVQISLNPGANLTLIYGKDHEPLGFNGGEFPRSVGERVLNNRIKGYFNAHITPKDMLSIDCDIPDQDW